MTPEEKQQLIITLREQSVEAAVRMNDLAQKAGDEDDDQLFTIYWAFAMSYSSLAIALKAPDVILSLINLTELHLDFQKKMGLPLDENLLASVADYKKLLLNTTEDHG